MRTQCFASRSTLAGTLTADIFISMEVTLLLGRVAQFLGEAVSSFGFSLRYSWEAGIHQVGCSIIWGTCRFSQSLLLITLTLVFFFFVILYLVAFVPFHCYHVTINKLMAVLLSLYHLYSVAHYKCRYCVCVEC